MKLIVEYKNIFKCECGNHQSFRSLEKVKRGSTWETNCNYCQKISNMKFVENVEAEN